MEEGKLNKKIILGIIIVVSFLGFIFSLMAYFNSVSQGQQCSVTGECPHEEQVELLTVLIPILASIGVGIGAGTYYFMSSKIEEKEKSLKKNTDILLKFLNPDERKLVNQLIEGKGKVLQAEITRLPGMTKVKSHRVIQKLIDRGVIESEQLGKTRIVRFSKEIKEGLL